MDIETMKKLAVSDVKHRLENIRSLLSDKDYPSRAIDSFLDEARAVVNAYALVGLISDDLCAEFMNQRRIMFSENLERY